MPTKPWYQSWTLWFNVAAAAYEVFNQAGAFTSAPPQVAAVILIVGNLLLRFKSSQGLHLLP